LSFPDQRLTTAETLQERLLFYRRRCSTPGRVFWTSVMRLNMVLRLVRDLAWLVVESDPRRRAVLRQQVDAWATALLGAD
jgi:hypothetical protein